MGLLTLILALSETISDTVINQAKNLYALTEKKMFEDIKFNDIATVLLDGVETAYRTYEEEEFDPVMSDF